MALQYSLSGRPNWEALTSPPVKQRNGFGYIQGIKPK